MKTLAADHFLFVVLALGLPVFGLVSWRRLRRRLAEGQEGARLAAYSGTIVLQWALVVEVFLIWLTAGRPPSALGLVVPRSIAFLVTAGVVGATGTLMLLQARAVRTAATDVIERLRAQLQPLEGVLPHTLGERAVFFALSATAGFCEEVLYRGFLIGYLTPWLGTWGAALASSAVFGLGHAYQGAAGVAKTAALGFAAAVIYVVSGSLWPAVALHVVMDVQGGIIGYEVFGRRAVKPAA